MNRFNQILKTRRSVREFQARKVTRKITNELIDLARWAPSAHNTQPWRFAILESKELRNRLAREMGKAFKKDLERDHFAPEVIQARIQKSIERIVGAPLLILVCLRRGERNIFPDRRRNRLEEHMAHQSIGAAIQNILLGAHALGLGACWISAPLFCPRTIKRVLNIDTRWEPIALVLLGYPKECPKAPSRYRIKKVTLRLP
jgi:F420 biosynthesis protein FbiB-like protein